MGIGELNVDVLLINAWEFAMEFVGILDFLYVEFGTEGLEMGAGRAVDGTRHLVEFIEEAED